MSARTGLRAVAVAAVLGLAVTACSGDSDDDRDDAKEREWPETLNAACVEVGELLQPAFDEAEGPIDYERIAEDLGAYIENGDDERIAEVLQPLADAAEGRVAVAEADEDAAQAQEDLFETPSEIPSEVLSLEPGEVVTHDLEGPASEEGEASAAAAAAADEAFLAAHAEVASACEAEGAPLVDPEAVERENAEIEEELAESGAPEGDPNASVAPEEETQP